MGHADKGHLSDETSRRTSRMTTDWASLSTEQLNPATTTIDEMPTPAMLAVINSEDAKVASALRGELSGLAEVVDVAAAVAVLVAAVAVLVAAVVVLVAAVVAEAPEIRTRSRRRHATTASKAQARPTSTVGAPSALPVPWDADATGPGTVSPRRAEGAYASRRAIATTAS